jgi:hypothetical protein
MQPKQKLCSMVQNRNQKLLPHVRDFPIMTLKSMLPWLLGCCCVSCVALQMQAWGINKENVFSFSNISIVAYLLKARVVEPEEMATARELHGKHVSVVMSTHATIEKPWKWCLLCSPHWGYITRTLWAIVAGQGQQQNSWTEAVRVTNTDDRPDLSSEGVPDIDKTVNVK